MLSKILSASVTGVDASIVQVEVDLCNGIPSFTMTGYLGARVKEAGDRVRTAIKNTGYRIPSSRIVVNVSPASIRKSGTMLDLPVAVGILADMGIVEEDRLKDTMILGEMSLDGSINGICGVLPMICKAEEKGIKCCILPWENQKEAALISGMKIIGVQSLQEVIRFINRETDETIEFSEKRSFVSKKGTGSLEVDFCDVKGQYMAKRAILIAAAGRHNLLLSGPPGSGKTLLASRIPTILPEMSREEIIEVSKIYSVAGLLNEEGCMHSRPFRAPHHTISQSALLGGGSIPLPGEITLAHQGVLFLDELTKFRGNVLECLRQPLEERQITIIRSTGICRFPSDVMLVAALNPCKCGYYPDRNLCRCTENDIMHHLGKLSRPFLDRFDMTVHVEKPQYEELAGDIRPDVSRMLQRIRESAEEHYIPDMGSRDMKKMVEEVVAIQKKRYQKFSICYNSQLDTKQMKQFCRLDEKGNQLMKKAYECYDLSARGYSKVLRVARTIADLEHSEEINCSHLSEAICFRNLEFLSNGF